MNPIDGRRRALLKLIWVAPAAALVGRSGTVQSSTMASRSRLCVARPRQTEGPYFLDDALEHSDLRSMPGQSKQHPGVRLDLAIQVARIERERCIPLAGAIVDIWHCDAQGRYSGFKDFGGQFDTRGEHFLRGFQRTDSDGIARFTTIYPGWYRGRAVHIHFKVRNAPEAEDGFEFVSQLYFDEAVNDEVLVQAPYVQKGSGRTRNHQDGIFKRGGDRLILPVQPTDEGYQGTFDLGLDFG